MRGMMFAILLALSAPATNVRGPQYADAAWAGIHQGNPKRVPMTLIFGVEDGKCGLFCRVPDDLRNVVER